MLHNLEWKINWRKKKINWKLYYSQSAGFKKKVKRGKSIFVIFYLFFLSPLTNHTSEKKGVKLFSVNERHEYFPCQAMLLLGIQSILSCLPPIVEWFINVLIYMIEKFFEGAYRKNDLEKVQIPSKRKKKKTLSQIK